MTDNNSHSFFMNRALELAQESINKGGFPSGALIVFENKIIGEGIALGNLLHDPSAHGEMTAIRQACQATKSSYIEGATLYSNLMPCLMCFGASSYALISKIYYAAGSHHFDPAYYRGIYTPDSMNALLSTRIDLIQLKDFEAQSIALVRNFENQ